LSRLVKSRYCVLHYLDMISYGWQIDPKIWEQIPKDISQSDNWKHVTFMEADSAGVDEKPGIYCFCALPVGIRRSPSESANDLFSRLSTPIYVGKTDNLRRRFIQHCRRPSSKVQAARHCFGLGLSFWFHVLPLERISIEEARLIRCFGPTANEREEKIKATVGAGISVGVQG